MEYLSSKFVNSNSIDDFAVVDEKMQNSSILETVFGEEDEGGKAEISSSSGSDKEFDEGEIEYDDENDLFIKENGDEDDEDDEETVEYWKNKTKILEAKLNYYKTESDLLKNIRNNYVDNNGNTIDIIKFSEFFEKYILTEGDIFTKHDKEHLHDQIRYYQTLTKVGIIGSFIISGYLSIMICGINGYCK